MAKLVLNNVVPSDGEVNKAATINNNSDAIEAALENTLSRDGTSPNEMESELDMNSNSIINLPEATGATTNTTVVLRSVSLSQSATALSVGAVAIGRWY